MVERLAALDKAGRVAHAQHDEAIFMCEARRDALCAVLEASEMMAAATRVDELEAQEMVAVLSEQFEALGGHCDEALKTARSLKLE